MDDVEPFQLDEIGGDVVAEENDVIAVIDGVKILNTVDTRNKVPDVESAGLEDPPGGENV